MVWMSSSVHLGVQHGTSLTGPPAPSVHVLAELQSPVHIHTVPPKKAAALNQLRALGIGVDLNPLEEE